MIHDLSPAFQCCGAVVPILQLREHSTLHSPSPFGYSQCRSQGRAVQMRRCRQKSSERNAAIIRHEVAPWWRPHRSKSGKLGNHCLSLCHHKLRKLNSVKKSIQYLKLKLTVRHGPRANNKHSSQYEDSVLGCSMYK